MSALVGLILTVCALDALLLIGMCIVYYSEDR